MTKLEKILCIVGEFFMLTPRGVSIEPNIFVSDGCPILITWRTKPKKIVSPRDFEKLKKTINEI